MEEAEIPDSTWQGCLVWAEASHHRGVPSPSLRSSGSWVWRELLEHAQSALMKWGECILNNTGASSQSINFIEGLKGKNRGKNFSYFKHYASTSRGRHLGISSDPHVGTALLRPVYLEMTR